jgi:hypothetical protein
MSLPPIAYLLISEYSKPLTHPLWKQGSYHGHAFKNMDIMIILQHHYNGFWFDIDWDYNIPSFVNNIMEFGDGIFYFMCNKFYYEKYFIYDNDVIDNPKEYNFYYFLIKNNLLKQTGYGIY